MKAENANLLKIEELERRVAELEMNGLLALLEIRKAIGDPEGRLSQPEVVKKVREMVEALQRIVVHDGSDNAWSNYFEVVAIAEKIINPPTP